jgi:uncharacterized protein involved in tolerance to divalent cations
MNSELVELVITCGSWQEAQRIADALLEMRLVENIETFEIKPTHWWEGHPHGTQQVKLLVLALPEHFNEIQSLSSTLKNINTQSILLTEIIT